MHAFSFECGTAKFQIKLQEQAGCTFTLVQEGEDIHVSMGVQPGRQLPFLDVRLLLGRDGRVVVPGCIEAAQGELQACRQPRA